MTEKRHAEKCDYPVCDCDGYHTFDELYEHRFALFEALTKSFLAWGNSIGGRRVEPERDWSVWRSRLHNDGSMYDGWFIVGVGKEPDEQITYHIPDRLWDSFDHCETLERAPEWDGHTPDDVLKRLRNF